jgi:hypothetical protein
MSTRPKNTSEPAFLPTIIPGSHGTNAYGSLGESHPFGNSYHAPATVWQAERNVDVQRVTRNAMIYELIQQQAKTIQSVVP